MNNRVGNSLLIKIIFLVASGFLVFLAGFGSSSVFAYSGKSDHEIYSKPGSNEHVLLVQHKGPPEGRGPMHGGRDRHCSQMNHGEGCPGGRGMRHRGGMGHGMHHGGEQSGSAQCPQPRATVKAPEDFYNRTNPVENTPDTVEQGRLLFQLDAQPSCVMCHGSQGDGTGGFGANLSPSPRNFTCTETMKDIPDGQLFWVIRNGSPDTGMPPFQDLQDEQIWKLIIFIRSLAQ